MKRLALAATFIAAVGCTKKPTELKTDDQKTIYSIGHMYGERMKQLSLTKEEVEIMSQGFVAAANGETSAVDVKSLQNQVQEFIRTRVEAVAGKEKEKGTGYLEDFVKNGATKTESGLAYKIKTPGSEAKPKPTDIVEVHYHGTTTDGTVFDSSKERGQTVRFPLNGVIPGWTEGLQLIGEGGSVTLVIPPELAYGERGSPPKIPGGATLVFEVELVRINPPEETKEDAAKVSTVSPKEGDKTPSADEAKASETPASSPKKEEHSESAPATQEAPKVDEAKAATETAK